MFVTCVIALVIFCLGVVSYSFQMQVKIAGKCYKKLPRGTPKKTIYIVQFHFP